MFACTPALLRPSVRPAGNPESLSCSSSFSSPALSGLVIPSFFPAPAAPLGDNLLSLLHSVEQNFPKGPETVLFRCFFLTSSCFFPPLC